MQNFQISGNNSEYEKVIYEQTIYLSKILYKQHINLYPSFCKFFFGSLNNLSFSNFKSCLKENAFDMNLQMHLSSPSEFMNYLLTALIKQEYYLKGDIYDVDLSMIYNSESFGQMFMNDKKSNSFITTTNLSQLPSICSNVNSIEWHKPNFADGPFKILQTAPVLLDSEKMLASKLGIQPFHIKKPLALKEMLSLIIPKDFSSSYKKSIKTHFKIMAMQGEFSEDGKLFCEFQGSIYNNSENTMIYYIYNFSANEETGIQSICPIMKHHTRRIMENSSPMCGFIKLEEIPTLDECKKYPVSQWILAKDKFFVYNKIENKLRKVKLPSNWEDRGLKNLKKLPPYFNAMGLKNFFYDQLGFYGSLESQFKLFNELLDTYSQQHPAEYEQFMNYSFRAYYYDRKRFVELAKENNELKISFEKKFVSLFSFLETFEADYEISYKVRLSTKLREKILKDRVEKFDYKATAYWNENHDSNCGLVVAKVAPALEECKKKHMISQYYITTGQIFYYDAKRKELTLVDIEKDDFEEIRKKYQDSIEKLNPNDLKVIEERILLTVEPDYNKFNNFLACSGAKRNEGICSVVVTNKEIIEKINFEKKGRGVSVSKGATQNSTSVNYIETSEEFIGLDLYYWQPVLYATSYYFLENTNLDGFWQRYVVYVTIETLEDKKIVTACSWVDKDNQPVTLKLKTPKEYKDSSDLKNKDFQNDLLDEIKTHSAFIDLNDVSYASQIRDEMLNTQKELLNEFKEFIVSPLTLKDLLSKERCFLEKADYFIENRQNINLQDKDGKTPLHHVCENEKFSSNTIKLLVENKANLNLQDKDGAAPLHKYLCRSDTKKNRLDLIKVFYENKADLNLKNKYDNTFLHYYNTSLKILKFFIKNGVDINLKNKDGMVSWFPNSNGNNIPSVKAINLLTEKKADINESDHRQLTLLHKVCKNKNSTLTILGCLIDNKADVNKVDSKGYTPLHYYLQDNKNISFEFLKYLVDNGSDVCAKNKFGDMPLHTYLGGIARNYRNYTSISLEIVKYFIENGIDINVKDESGNTFLHLVCCARKVSLESIKYLVENKADVNAIGDKGHTVLQAYMKKIDDASLDIIKYLVANGASLNVIDEDGKTLLHLYIHSFIKCSSNIIEYLIENSININAIDNNGDTIFHKYMDSDIDVSLDIIQFFLKKKANVNAKNKAGNTPLHIYMKRHGSILSDVVQFLADNQADINEQNENGDTPLHVYMLSGNSVSLDIVKSFMKNGTDIDIPNKRKETIRNLLLRKSKEIPSEKSNDIMNFLEENSKSSQHNDPENFSIEKNSNTLK